MPDIDESNRCRNDIRARFEILDDLHPGSLRVNYRKCSKPDCHCVGDDNPGRGPSYVLDSSILGRALSVRIPLEEFEQT